MSIDEWRPAAFASHFRQQDPVPPVDRWEDVLRAEQSPAHQLLATVARSPRLRRLLGIPADVDLEPGGTLAEREARVKAVQGTRAARVIDRVLGRRERHSPRPGGIPGGLPPVGPLLDHEIDAALAVVSSMAFQEIQRRGWHLQPKHYYWPLNDLEYLRGNRRLWIESKAPLDVDWDLEGQAELAQRLGSYSGELADVPDAQRAPGEFAWGQAFSGLDAYAYYGLVRERRPARVVEVGAGISSTLLARALAVNGERCEVTLIDPAPRWEVLGELPEHWQVLPNVVQDVDPSVFSSLESGDILFYDGSHCVRTGSDVNWMFFEVLPLLPAGVWIHVHDMFWPRDYWDEWIFDEGFSWNEQYFVQAFLMNNRSYRVRFAAKMLHYYKRGALDVWFPENIADAGSLWLEKVA